MKKNTKNFLNLIFEQEESKTSGESNKTKDPKATKEKKPSDQSADSSDTLNLQVLSRPTSNKISAGRPISDPGLADIRHRAEAGAAEAASLLKDLGIKGISGSNWYQQIESLFKSASGSELSALVNGAQLVKSPSGDPGVVISLNSRWTDDEKSGKRSYGFIRSLVIAAMKTGSISMRANKRRKLRIEVIEGNNQLLVYVSNKALSWMK